MKTTISTFLLITLFMSSYAQDNFSNSPLSAKFITHDYDNFWKMFDQLDRSNSNPFSTYLQQASPGLKPYEAYFNVDTLYSIVLKRKADYLKSKPILDGLNSKKKEIQASYAAFKYWYPDAVFPPIYFVVGMFTTGGTVSENGLLIGAEKLENLDGLNGLVSHELIHFQQKYSKGNNLLKQSIKEGSADFLGELISGEHINMEAFNYGEKHEEALCKEFVSVMRKDFDYTDWLYGTSGKDDRPNDLGYWIGYKITEAYFNKQNDKHQAIYNILHLKDPEVFLKESGYLEPYLK